MFDISLLITLQVTSFSSDYWHHIRRKKPGIKLFWRCIQILQICLLWQVWLTREAVTDQAWLPFISYSRMVKNWRLQNNKIHKNTGYYRADLHKMRSWCPKHCLVNMLLHLFTICHFFLFACLWYLEVKSG